MITNVPDLIFFCGFMGTGKTTIGQSVAKQLGRPFMDLDTAIEKQLGTSIRSAFKEKGENYFRKTEHAVLLDTIRNFQGIVALGGGALHNQHVVDHIKLNGLLIFIETPISVILERISDDPDRPLLLDENGKVKDRKTLQGELQQLYEQRLPLYEQAEIRIDSSKFPSVNLVVTKLIKKIQYHVSYH